MKVMVNVERSQLQGVLWMLGAKMDIVINIKEPEEFEKKTVDDVKLFRNLTTEDLQRIQKEVEKREK